MGKHLSTIRNKLFLGFMVLLALSMALGSLAPGVLADTLPADELTALDDYTHWVGGVGACGATDPGATAAAAPAAATNNKIYVIGDSLTVGMRDAGGLKARLITAGWDVTGIEATSGITIDASVPKVEANAGSVVSQAGTVIVGLGTNRSADPPAQIDRMIAAIHAKSANARIFWINAFSTKASYAAFNHLLDARVAPDKITAVLDWAKEATTNASTYSLASDRTLGIHTGPAGYVARSKWVVSGVGAPAAGASGTANGATPTAGAAPAAAAITIAGPFLPKAVPSNTIHVGDAYKGNASTYGNDPATGFIDPGDVGPNGQPLLPALAGATNAQPAIAVYNHGSLGGWWKVIAPNGKAAILQQTDIGPSTPRITDINSAAAKAVFGYPQGNSFPTDQGAWKIEYLGKTKPAGAIASVADAAGGAAPAAAAPIACCPATAGAGGAAGGPLTGPTNAAKAFNYFMQAPRSLSAEAAAGIVGNMMVESGGLTENLDTHAHNNISGTHDGIVQWSGSRWAALQTHEVGKDPYDLAVQLDYVWFELVHSYPATLAALKSTHSAQDAASIFNNGPPVPAFEASGPSGNDPGRRTAAQHIFGRYGSGAAPVPDPGGAGAATPAACAAPSATAGGGVVDGLFWPFATKSSSQYFRVDQGWDIQDAPGANVYAIASGTIHKFNPDPGNFGNDYPTEKLDVDIGGPSQWVYYGHVHMVAGLDGKHVNAGQLVAHANRTDPENGSGAPAGWLEIGFAQPGTDAPTDHCAHAACAGDETPAGLKMKSLLINTNPAPSH